MSAAEQPWPRDGLFARLRAACAPEWRRYVEHDFVRELARGTLPERAFRHYLGQDYLFLIQFARAYALAVYKSSSLQDMRDGLAGLKAILDDEMSLHLRYCRSWGLSEADVEHLPEAPATLAYTRYVLETGMAGDLLDLRVALAPCIVGYGEIGWAMARDPATRRDANPYRDWIATYGGADYQAIALSAAAGLDRLWQERAGGGRFERLVRIFGEATRLEADFWQMGLSAG
ncbi:MAG: thiaminase II [Alphaproteobacteria bacterium]|nr:thiaminase II [Alphaproteobacteria bacterium]